MIEEARILYREITASGCPPPDVDLARSPTYRRFLHVGISLVTNLGEERLNALVENFFDDAREDSERAAPILAHLWCGLGSLYGRPPTC